MTNVLETANTLVVSGGGIIGFAALGALIDLCDNGLSLEKISTFVGTSIGSVIVTFLCIGYRPKEIYSLMTETDISTLLHVMEDSLTFDNVERLIKDFGIDTGALVMGFICDRFLAKGVDPRITFSAYRATYKKNLHIVATNIDETQPVYFNADTHPDDRITDALRRSISIPYTFTAPWYKGDRYADGGLMDNFPIAYAAKLSTDDPPAIVGINTRSTKRHRCTNIFNFSRNVLRCCLRQSSSSADPPGAFVVDVCITSVEAIDFEVPPSTRLHLLKQGMLAASKKRGGIDVEDPNAQSPSEKSLPMVQASAMNNIVNNRSPATRRSQMQAPARSQQLRPVQAQQQQQQQQQQPVFSQTPLQTASPQQATQPNVQSSQNSKAVPPPFAPLTEQSGRLDIDSDVFLFDHQKAMLYKMAEIEHFNAGGQVTTVGVLADEPGSGKSYAILALILREKRRVGQTQNMIIIPENLLKQWVTFVQTFSKDLTYRLFTQYGQITQLYFDARALFSADIIFTTSVFYPTIQSVMTQLSAWFNRTVLDECDSISFFTSKAIPSKNVWLVSASADQLASGAYHTFKSRNVVKCEREFIQKSIRLPDPVYETHLCYNPHVELLRGIIPDLRAVNGIDFSGFRFEHLKNESVGSAKELFSAIFRDYSFGLAAVMESIPQLEEAVRWNPLDPTLQASLNTALDNRKRLMIRLNAIYDKIDGKVCPMCVEPFSLDLQALKTPCCSAIFCRMCTTKHLQKTGKCIKCFGKLSESQLMPVDASGDANFLHKQGNDKWEEFAVTLERELQLPDFRALIFSDYHGSFRGILSLLDAKGIKHATIEGNEKQMQKAIDQYKSSDVPVLLIDSIQYAAGMNLECTSVIFILHKTQRREQIIGRGQRLGRDTRLRVHEFFYANEM